MKDKWIVVAILAFVILLAGCQKSQWGRGDPPAKWRKTFGNDNMARLNYVQTQRVDEHRAIISGVTIKDPNGQPVRKRGLIERITTLESLFIIDANSPGKATIALAKLNAEQHLKMGKVDIALHKRIKALETADVNSLAETVVAMYDDIAVMQKRIEALEKLTEGLHTADIEACKILLNLRKDIAALQERPEIIFTETSKPNMPYIYEDPIKYDSNEPGISIMGGITDTACSKHGRLLWGSKYAFEGSEKSYCSLCVADVVRTGRPHRVAVAIALEEARKARKK